MTSKCACCGVACSITKQREQVLVLSHFESESEESVTLKQFVQQQPPTSPNIIKAAHQSTQRIFKQSVDAAASTTTLFSTFLELKRLHQLSFGDSSNSSQMSNKGKKPASDTTRSGPVTRSQTRARVVVNNAAPASPLKRKNAGKTKQVMTQDIPEIVAGERDQPSGVVYTTSMEHIKDPDLLKIATKVNPRAESAGCTSVFMRHDELVREALNLPPLGEDEVFRNGKLAAFPPEFKPAASRRKQFEAHFPGVNVAVQCTCCCWS